MTANQKASVRDGMYYAVMIGCGEAYLGAFAVHLHASTTMVGLLAALPPFIGALFQLLAVRTLDRISDRRRLIVNAVIVQAGSWLMIASLGLFFGYGTATVLALLFISFLHYGAGGFIGPIWSSLIGDLVPERTRGEFFGYRNKQAGLLSFLSVTLSGAVLQLCAEEALPDIGFVAIFVAAAIARTFSVYWLVRHDNPDYYAPPEASFTFTAFVRQLFTSNFAKFSLYVGAMNIAVFVAGPYFTVYLLRDLKLSYLAFTAIAAGATVAQFVTVQRWGTLIDKYGSKRVLTLSSWSLSIVPFLWLLSDNFWYLFCVQFYAGAVWGGFQLTTVTFLFDAVSRPKRARCAAYQGILGSLGMLIGSLIGALQLHYATAIDSALSLSADSRVPMYILFALSGVLRCTASAFFLRKFKEVREVSESMRKDFVFRLAQLRPFAGSNFTIIPRFRNGKDKHKD